MVEPRGARARWRAARDLLRKPVLVVGEVAALALAAALAAVLPQEPDLEAIGQFSHRWPVAARVVSALGLHRVTTSGWFLALVALALASLLVVQWEQWRRLARVWSARPEPNAFARAPYRKELALAEGRATPAPRLVRRGRPGLLGSPIFHLGLLTVVGAGLLRLLLFADGGVRLFEGETVPPGSEAWHGGRGGPLSRPFALDRPLRLEEMRPSRYESGALLQVEARLAVLGGAAPDVREVRINAPLELGRETVYILQAHGPTALVELQTAGGARAEIVYLEQREQDYRGRLLLPDGRELRFRVVYGGRKDAVEVRHLRGPALLGVATLAPGSEMPLGPGESLHLEGLPWWGQFWGSRDLSQPFFFAGVTIAIVGIVLLFGFVPVDEAVFVEGRRVVVAMRPLRFAPLFAERFERLCQEVVD
ncbi:MAG TPA: cytochrome c biogenesis protein ResB [Anaeromyxobacteraceae bacterium]|nr:cytochrome c biogenesis protein ResB [Anaeromyxobacteraceae bacterium]